MHTRAPSLPYVQEAFEKIAMAKVSGSALEAQEMGFHWLQSGGTDVIDPTTVVCP